MWARNIAGATLLAACVVGCAYTSLGPIDEHYQTFKARMPEGDSVFVCSSYGCRTQTRFRFTPTDIATLQNMMSAAHAATPAEERQALGRRSPGWNAGWVMRLAPPLIGRGTIWWAMSNT